MMKRRCFLALFAALLPASVARADVPLPSHLHYVDPQMAFEEIGDHADYVFYLRYLTFVGGPGNTPHSYRQVGDSKPFILDCERRLIDMQLLAIKRDDFVKRSKGEKSLAWLTDETEGVLAAEVDPPSTVAPKKLKTPPLHKYQVQLKNGALEVNSTASPELEETNSRSMLPTSMAGLALAGAVASLGLLIVRRRKGERPEIAA